MKHIPNYPWYMITENGEVYHVMYGSKKKINAHKNSSEYLRVYIAGKWRFVHRLVVMTYKPHPKFEKLEVHHEDNNKHNNHVDNLRLVTKWENLRLRDERKKSLQNISDCPF